jgi:hypothetical protein
LLFEWQTCGMRRRDKKCVSATSFAKAHLTLCPLSNVFFNQRWQPSKSDLLSLPFFSDSRCVYAGARRVTMDANDSLANAIKRACNACMHAHTQYSRHRETEARNVHADRARKPHIYPWPGSRLVGSRRVCAPVPWVISLSVSLHSRVARELILVPNIAPLLKQWGRDVKNNQTHYLYDAEFWCVIMRSYLLESGNLESNKLINYFRLLVWKRTISHGSRWMETSVLSMKITLKIRPCYSIENLKIN